MSKKQRLNPTTKPIEEVVASKCPRCSSTEVSRRRAAADSIEHEGQRVGRVFLTCAGCGQVRSELTRQPLPPLEIK